MSTLVPLLRWTELCAALVMTGLIWFVQVVHYPLFAEVGSDGNRYQAEHMRRTTWVVAVPMLAEAGASGVLALMAVGPSWQRWPATALLALVWGATALVLVPAHDRLLRGFDVRVHRRLVRGNWLRTFGWTARAALCVAAMATTSAG